MEKSEKNLFNISYCYAIIIIKCTYSNLFKTNIMAPDGVQNST